MTTGARVFRLRLASLLIVLLAVAFRLYGLPSVPHSYDRGYPHGLGLLIQDAVIDGRWSELPVVSLVASINVFNPAGASYVWALFGAIEPSPFVATVVVALLHAIVVCASAQRIARHMFGPHAALLAGLFAATSLWGGWVARGAWLQGMLEVFTALSAWLLFSGFVAGRQGRVTSGFVVAALAAQTYLTAFGLFAQVLLAGAIGVIQRARPFRRAILIGCAALVLSLGLYAAAFIAARGDVRTAIDNPNAINTDLAPGGTNLDPVAHTLRLVTGRDYENTFGPVAPLGWRDRISDLQATLLDVLFLIGVLGTFWQARRRQQVLHRMALMWLLLPMLATGLIANGLMRDWKVHVFYLTLGSPVMYALAAAPYAWLVQIRSRLAHALAISLAVLHTLTMAGNLSADIDLRNRYPLGERAPYTLDNIPLGATARISQHVTQRCAQVLSQYDPVWLSSWAGAPSPTHAQAYSANAISEIARVEPGSPACHIGTTASALADNTRVFELSSDGPAQVIVGAIAVPSTTTTLYTSNLGWSLLTLEAPTRARPGETVSVRHAWRVDTLPDEPFATWYFAPFVTLIAADGARVVAVDQARALTGDAWHPGTLMLSHIALTIPADTSPGTYTLEFSLFDPNQKKNAVYFDLADPGQPLVTLQRKMIIE
jgi:hypothetical protein